MEHNASIGLDTERPTRLAKCQYDVVSANKVPEFHECIAEIDRGVIRYREVVDTQHHASLTFKEFDHLVAACDSSSMFKDALAELTLPDCFEVIIEPWPYGGLDPSDNNKRFFQGLCFAQDKRSRNEDFNFYGYPLPLIPVMDAHTRDIVRFIITLANYEYIFAYKFDQSGGIAVETRATGIVSVVNIDVGKASYYGNVVSPGALAQSHQHIFAVRIDTAIDGDKNTVIEETSHRVPMNAKTNPNGNLYEICQNIIKKSQWLDAAPWHNQVIKMVDPSKKNPISGKPVGYEFMPAATQLLLADPNSVQSKRALFAQHHIWVTKYTDGELYAGGKYTLQSQKEIGGVGDAAARRDTVENEDVVVRNVFGFTHNPRVENWPVMPVDIHELHIKPADFFTANPSIDVPSNKNLTSQLLDESCCSKT